MLKIVTNGSHASNRAKHCSSEHSLRAIARVEQKKEVYYLRARINWLVLIGPFNDFRHRDVDANGPLGRLFDSTASTNELEQAELFAYFAVKILEV
jgi:hypothetical protein